MRDAHRALAFGEGIHYCPGSALGKVEARLALIGWRGAGRNSFWCPDSGSASIPNISFRGAQELWVEVGPEN